MNVRTESARHWAAAKTKVASGLKAAQRGTDEASGLLAGASLLAAPAFVALTASFFLGFVEQVYELYRAMTERLSATQVKVVIAGVYSWTHLLVSVLLLSVACYYVGRMLVFLHVRGFAEDRSYRKHIVTSILGALAITPLVSFMWGLVNALPFAESGVNKALLIVSGIWVVGAAGLIVFKVHQLRHVSPDAIAVHEGGGAAEPTLKAMAVGFATMAAVLFTFTLLPNLVGRIGVVALFLNFELCLLLALFLLVDFGRRKATPVVSTLVLLAFVFGALELNDNHRVRTRMNPADATRIDFDTAFERWLRNRHDLASYSQYPVFIIASEGGGIRAAYFSALVLAQLQEYCPAFAQHVFAISGVSGGSVGGTVFTTLARDAANAEAPACSATVRSDDRYTKVSSQILGRDHLGPLMAGALGPDFIARFMPWPLEFADRARFLEDSLSTAARDASNGRHDLSYPLLSLNKTFVEGAHPSLFLNTTHVESGRRFVFTNIGHGKDALREVDMLADRDPRIDLDVGAAAVLSARFPYVTPAGFLDLPAAVGGEPFKHRFADGGYFDNTGVATAYDILSGMLSVSTRNDLPAFMPIIIHISNDPARPLGTPDPPPGWTDRGLEEVLSPIRTMINARDARRDQPINLLKTSMYLIEAKGVSTRGNAINPARAAYVDFGLNQDKLPLPLGWTLSGHAREEIAGQIGRPLSNADCDESVKKGAKARFHNGCSSAEVIRFLMPAQGQTNALQPTLKEVPVIREIHRTSGEGAKRATGN
jgi:hypothetical protein